MRSEIGYMMKDISDKSQHELSYEEIFEEFKNEYVNYFTPLDITDASFSHLSTTKSEDDDSFSVKMRVVIGDKVYNLQADGNGRLDAVSNALRKTGYHFDYKFITYSEHAVSADSNSKAAAYICIADSEGNKYWGVGTHADIVLASVNSSCKRTQPYEQKTSFCIAISKNTDKNNVNRKENLNMGMTMTQKILASHAALKA